jgi:hypothetical protein
LLFTGEHALGNAAALVEDKLLLLLLLSAILKEEPFSLLGSKELL